MTANSTATLSERINRAAMATVERWMNWRTQKPIDAELTDQLAKVGLCVVEIAEIAALRSEIKALPQKVIEELLGSRESPK